MKKKEKKRKKKERNINPNFLYGIINFPFMELSIIIYRDIKLKTLVSQQYRAWSDGRAGWPGSILVAKDIHFQCWQNEGQDSLKHSEEL